MADTDYIDIPIEDDPEELASDAFELLQAQYPDWSPNDGNLDTWMIEAMARIGAEVQRLATQVPREIFMFAGQDLFRVEPGIGVSATASSTWTMIDSLGYTIPEGTLVGIRTSGDELVPFQTVVEIQIINGQSVNNNVSIIAVEEGVDASGIGSIGQGMEMIDSLDFIASVTLNGPTTGGEDAETVDDYLNRLRETLALLSPRPILAVDYAPLAMAQPGIGRAVAIDNWVPGINEQQIINITPDPTGGTFTLTFSGQTTSNILWNATPAQVQAALVTLSNIKSGDVVCSGTQLPAGSVIVEFSGEKAETNVAAITGTGTGLTGPGGPFSIVVTTPQEGVAAQTTAERAVTVAVTDENGEPVDPAERAELDAFLQSLREQNFIISVVDPNYSIIDVATTVKVYPEFTLADVDARVTEVITDFLSPKNWGKADLPLGARANESRTWKNELVIRYLEVAAAINSVEGVDYITTLAGSFSLTLCVQGEVPDRIDLPIYGTVPLPRPGVINVTAIH